MIKELMCHGCNEKILLSVYDGLIVGRVWHGRCFDISLNIKNQKGILN